MRTARRLWARLRNVVTTRNDERRLQEEIEQHLALQTAENIRAGMKPEEARRQAMLKFGPVEAMRESYRAERGLPLVETALQDCRYALPILRRSPGFALIAVLSLAVGIGATTAVFSIVYATLIHPYPFRDWERLVTLTVQDQKGNLRQVAINGEQLRQLRTASVIEEVVAFDGADLTDRKSTRLNSSHEFVSRMPSSA